MTPDIFMNKACKYFEWQGGTHTQVREQIALQATLLARKFSDELTEYLGGKEGALHYATRCILEDIIRQ